MNGSGGGGGGLPSFLDEDEKILLTELAGAKEIDLAVDSVCDGDAMECTAVHAEGPVTIPAPIPVPAPALKDVRFASGTVNLGGNGVTSPGAAVAAVEDTARAGPSHLQQKYDECKRRLKCELSDRKATRSRLRSIVPQEIQFSDTDAGLTILQQIVEYMCGPVRGRLESVAATIDGGQVFSDSGMEESVNRSPEKSLWEEYDALLDRVDHGMGVISRELAAGLEPLGVFAGYGTSLLDITPEVTRSLMALREFKIGSVSNNEVVSMLEANALRDADTIKELRARVSQLQQAGKCEMPRLKQMESASSAFRDLRSKVRLCSRG